MTRRLALAGWVNQRVFYGWLMVAIGFAAMFATGPGQSFNIGLFFGPLTADLGLSSTALSATYGLGTAVAALGLSYSGRLIDRYGQRATLAGVAFLLGVVCLLFPYVTNVVALFFGFTAVRFLGQGSLMLVANNLVSQWFSARRGVALSIISLGFALGLAAYPPVVQSLIDSVGWRTSWIWLGLFVWVLMLPITLALVINRPDDLGLLPDGARRPDELSGGPEPAAADGDLEESWTPREAMRSFTFWFLAVSLAIPSALVTAIYIYQVPYFAQQGLDAQTAANMFSVTSVSMVAAMLGFGQLLDRLETRYVVAGGILLNAAAMGMMLLARDTLTAVIYAILLGAASGSMLTNPNYLWPRYFGRQHLGSIQGPAYTITIIGASAGPLPFGIAYDLLGSYREAVMVLALLPLAFGLAVAFVKPPVRPGAVQEPAPSAD